MSKLRAFFDKRKRATKVRRELSAGTHIGWAGLVIALLGVTAGRALSVEAIADETALVAGSLGVVCLLVWAFLGGWRLRSPIWRLPRRKQLTRAEQERQ